MMRAAVSVAIGTACVTASTVDLVTFDGAPGTTFDFKELNDPVMGGQSTGMWHVDTTGHFGVFEGDVATVPSLHAPGFITAAADGKFNDASSAFGGDLVLEVRTSTPNYAGFRVSFAAGTLSPAYACAGGGQIPLSDGCFKAHFWMHASEDFITIRIPFSNFSDKWSPSTGNQVKTCADDESVCPTAKNLGGIQRMDVWAEGFDGKANLEVRAIRAESARQIGTSPPAGVMPPAKFNICKGPVQSDLRYGISGRTAPDVPAPVDANENLAEAVCCDSRAEAYAEPQFLFQAPDINLFSEMNAHGVTTFYDSVCGLPLFRAPVNRTFTEFKADTDEHGWPSFREGEVFTENVKIEKEYGFVFSSCGTHLGSYLPDAKGPRWCMDLSCIAGNPVHDGLLLV